MQFPAEFETRERALLGARFDALYAYATPEPARGVTVNTLRCPCAWFAAHADFAAAPSPFCAAAFTTGAAWRPGRHPWHHAGVLYAQEPSAAAPAALLDVRPGMRVADLCAAPGGKTLLLAQQMQDTGRLYSRDAAEGRISLIRQALERSGIQCADVACADASVWQPELARAEREFNQRFYQAKLEEKMLEFSDVEQLALSLLWDEEKEERTAFSREMAARCK